MSRQQQLNFLELPPEVLIQILESFLTILPGTTISLLDPEPWTLLQRRHAQERQAQDGERVKDAPELIPPSVFADSCAVLPILLVHPIIYALSIPILYSSTHVFTLDLTGSHHSHARSMFTQLASPQDSWDSPSEQRNILRNWLFLRNITSLKIIFDRLRGWTSTHIIPLLQRMILSGSLQHLHIHLNTTFTGNVQGLDKITKGAPLRAFVDLLGDPDLRECRMTVNEEVGKAWCDFHQHAEKRTTEGCGRLKSTSTGNEHVPFTDQESEISKGVTAEGIELEWWKLAQEADRRGL